MLYVLTNENYDYGNAFVDLLEGPEIDIRSAQEEFKILGHEFFKKYEKPIRDSNFLYRSFMEEMADEVSNPPRDAWIAMTQAERDSYHLREAKVKGLYEQRYLDKCIELGLPTTFGERQNPNVKMPPDFIEFLLGKGFSKVEHEEIEM